MQTQRGCRVCGFLSAENQQLLLTPGPPPGPLGVGVLPMSHPTVISPHIPHEVAMGWLRSPGTSHANTAQVPRLWIFEYLKSVVAVHARLPRLCVLILQGPSPWALNTQPRWEWNVPLTGSVSLYRSSGKDWVSPQHTPH